MSVLGVGLAMGIAGTAAMDVWALVLNRATGQPLPNWGMVGRWFGHLPRGTVFHGDIAASDRLGGELPIGWAAHYGVGALYGVVWALIAGAVWLADPSFLPVWIFSLLTIAAGWFLLQPGMGLGWAASKTPNPWKVRVLGVLAHTAFALGMWAAAVVL